MVTEKPIRKNDINKTILKAIIVIFFQVSKSSHLFCNLLNLLLCIIYITNRNTLPFCN